MKKLKSFEKLEEALAKLPGVGRKSAERMAYAMLNFSDEDLKEIATSIKDLKVNLSRCPTCGTFIENGYCEICNDSDRDNKTLMVVSFPKDIVSIENSNVYKGKYHVLNGELSPTKGIHIENLNLDNLFLRIDKDGVTEVILATNPTIDGETTALYIAKKLQDKNISITRLAYGLQMGGNLDYVDPLTLSRALEGRRKV